MPHKCVRCGNVFEDNNPNILRGCSCGSIFFLFIKSPQDTEKIKAVEEELIQKDTTLEKEIEKKIDEKKKAEDEIKISVDKKEKPKKKAEVEEIKFGIETVRVPKEGIYEINLEGLMKKQPVIILERGKVYFIHLPSAFEKVKERD